MKHIEFRIRVNEIGKPESNAWEENYKEFVDDWVTAESRAEEMIGAFNETLKPYESGRVLLSTQLLKSKYQCPECSGFYEQEQLDEFGGICGPCNFEQWN